MRVAKRKAFCGADLAFSADRTRSNGPTQNTAGSSQVKALRERSTLQQDGWPTCCVQRESVPTKCSEFYYNGHPKLSYYHTIHAGGKPVNEEYCCPDDFSIGERLKRESEEAKKRAEEDAKSAEEAAAAAAAAKEAAEKKAAEREAREAARRAAEEQRKKEKAERVAAEMERQRILAEERASAEEEERKAQARAKAEKEEAKRLKDLADAAEAAKKAQEKADEEERIRKEEEAWKAKLDAQHKEDDSKLKRGCREASVPLLESFKNAFSWFKSLRTNTQAASQRVCRCACRRNWWKTCDEADPKQDQWQVLVL